MKDTVMGDEGVNVERSPVASVGTLFKRADSIDTLLMIFGFLGAIGDGLTLPAMLVMMSKVMNNLGNSHSFESSVFTRRINQNCVAFLYLACVSWVSSFLEGYCWTKTAERQASRLRIGYLKALLRQDVGYFDLGASSTAEVVTNVSNDSLLIQDVLSEKIPNTVMNVSTFLGSYLCAFVLMWRLAIVGLPFVVLLIIPGLMYGRMLMGLATKMIVEYNKAAIIAEQAISSIRTVYSFVGEIKTMEAFSTALNNTVELGKKQGLIKGMAIGSNGITFAIWSLMAWYGSRLVIYHGAQGGTVFATGASIVVGGLTLGTAISNVKYVSEACSAGERIMTVINRIPKIDSDNLEGEILKDVIGEIEFKNVEFSYPSRPGMPIFHDFCLKVRAGETLALVGSSGSGKSTVISLLERFYDPVYGDIFLDGVSIKKLQLRWLRSQMALVSQEPALFATSIKENIRFGKEDASMEEIEAAARAANAHTFISQLPEGYDTHVGERGAQMSGGQKQRIAIARAIVKSPKILLLDEATSALDSESERVVQEALDQARVGRTTIVIAHRLSTIRNADSIAVVQGGQIMEIGSHNSLIRNEQGMYYSLVRLQKMKDKEEEQNSMVQEESNVAATSGQSANGRSQRLSWSSSANSIPSTQIDRVEKNPSSEPLQPVPSFWRLWMLNKQEWKVALTGCLSATAFGAIQPTYAFTMATMISVFFLPNHSEIISKVRIYSLGFASLSVFSFIINIIEHYSFAAMGEALTKRIRELMLLKILTFEVGWFDRDENSSGVVCSRLAKDANVVRSLVGDRISLLVQTISAVVVACTIGLVVAWRLAIVMIAAQPLIIVCFYAGRVLLKKMSEKAIKSQDESCKLAAEAVSNIRTTTAFSSQARIINMFEIAQEGPKSESVRQSWYAGIGLGTSQSLMACTWALAFWYGGYLVSHGYINSKQLLRTFMVLLSTGRVIADAGSMTTDLAKGSDSVGTVFAVVDRETKIEPNDPEGDKPDNLRGEVEMNDVDFAYPSRPDIIILKSFCLKLEVGKSTALVGQSGSGKSTIIGLLERFYDPIKGVIKVDGRDIKSYNLRSLRKYIALVGQEPTLFAGSIRTNIAYGSENADEAEIRDAARIANADQFIDTLKDGYDTLCGERGVQLSGGQKQRIAIARALLKNPSILLLDEATSALDSQSEKVVQEALDKVMEGRTTVVVAHRLATIQNCHTIAVLESGKVVEKGTHSSLLAKGGPYSSLVKLQSGGSCGSS